MQDYVEFRDGGYYLANSRVSLDSVVTAFQNGAAPESILRSFPTIGSLVKVYGAVTFYLEHQNEVDRYLHEQDALAEALRDQQSPLPGELRDRLRAVRDRVSRTGAIPLEII
ncbi:MAG: hypothetical protein K2X03_07940 [Bryobacteraceae bacterium]|nr:hypothetical protein [Bryobacteraceae bacterium]